MPIKPTTRIGGEMKLTEDFGDDIERDGEVIRLRTLYNNLTGFYYVVISRDDHDEVACVSRSSTRAWWLLDRVRKILIEQPPQKPLNWKEREKLEERRVANLERKYLVKAGRKRSRAHQ